MHKIGFNKLLATFKIELINLLPAPDLKFMLKLMYVGENEDDDFELLSE